MSSALKSLATGLLGSRKAAALLVGLLATLLQIPLIQWLDMPQEKAVELATTISTQIVALVSAYIVGQGVADHGKEKVKAAMSAVNVAGLPPIPSAIKKAYGLALLAGLALGLQGCTLQGSYVTADRLTYEAVAPVYLRYTDDDRALDQASKDRRRELVESWRARIDEGELHEAAAEAGEGEGSE